METYDLEMHCHPIIDGKIGRLHSPIIHCDLDDLSHHFTRHNIYSNWEALLHTKYRRRSLDGENRPRLFGSAVERRRFLKRLFLSLPGKPVDLLCLLLCPEVRLPRWPTRLYLQRPQSPLLVPDQRQGI